MFRNYCLLVISFFLTISAHAKEQYHWQERDFIINSFIDIALQREYDRKQTPMLVRWERPIHIYVESDYGDSQLQAELLSIHARHLSKITGVPIYFTPNVKKANIIATFTDMDSVEDKVRRYIGPPDKIRTALDEAICLGNFSINSKGQIQSGVIIIPVDYARQNARFLDCIVEEITQLMGLPNDSDDVYPSVFNDSSTDIYLSPLDFILLKALYSPRLSAGMSVDQVDQNLFKVIDDLYYSGVIDNAASLVQEGSLKSYLGD
ncbi:hypothetical protein MGA5115_00642 [Marinomonas gallaica]|uniref:DUF2927 domain-containing protein n=1 Tax=Marinomonas gallaica TaxID=1806667 RepID=A0A1C3JN40_9GAMM|nr:DUF2927 domain-containing protein [Marinomonas gallaica]SBT16561.1 hypothetical protein MGA5115_00642 [Marinomonas gallaica]SBT20277.1 hypothetical protein MGA5116_00860 [Marinomonas gallaica]